MNKYEKFRLAMQGFIFGWSLICYGIGAVVARLFDKSLATMFKGGVIGILLFASTVAVRRGWENATTGQLIVLIWVPAIFAGIVGPLVTALIIKLPGTAGAIALALTVLSFFVLGRP